MSTTGRVDAPAGDAGFTLIEVTAVVAVIALLASFALPGLTRGSSRVTIEQTALRIAALMQADRYAAIRRHATIATIIDTRAREIRSGATGAFVVVPRDVSMRATISETCRVEGAAAGLGFYADGMSCGGGLALEKPGVKVEILANWLTGGVEIVASDSP